MKVMRNPCRNVDGEMDGPGSWSLCLPSLMVEVHCYLDHLHSSADEASAVIDEATLGHACKDLPAINWWDCYLHCLIKTTSK